MSKLQLQSVCCYLCDTTDADEWARENGYSAVKCRGCGLVYVDPRPDDAAISAAHQTGEHRTQDGSLQVTNTFSRRAVSRGARRLAAILPADARPSAWLDVGAGNGETLISVRALFGPGVVLRGVEPNMHKRGHAAAQGVTLFERLEDALDRRYDVISLVNVFSHLADPPAFLRALATHLDPGGSLVIVTGNGGDLDCRSEYPDRLDLPDHLSFVGRAQLERLMQRLGFVPGRIVELRHDTLRRTMSNVRRTLAGRPARIALPYRSRFRSMWCRFDRAS